MAQASESESDESENEGDGSNFKKKKKKEQSETEEIAKYVPPKLTSMPYEDDETAAAKQKERSRKSAINSTLIDEWKEEFLDTPVEISGGSRAQQMISRAMKERERYEEDNFVRLPMTKADKHRQKRLSTMGSLGDELTGFSGMDSSNGKGGARKRKGTGKKKASKKRKFH